MEPLVNFDIRW